MFVVMLGIPFLFARLEFVHSPLMDDGMTLPAAVTRNFFVCCTCSWQFFASVTYTCTCVHVAIPIEIIVVLSIHSIQPVIKY